MEEIKIGSIVATGIAIRLGSLHLRVGMIGLVLNIQDETAVVLTLDRSHKFVTKNLNDLKLNNSILNHRMNPRDLKEAEMRQLITVHLIKYGYELSYNSIRITTIDRVNDCIRYKYDSSSYEHAVHIYTESAIGYDPMKLDSFKCII